MDEINLFLYKFLQGKKKKEGYYTACLQLKWEQLTGEYIAQKSFPRAIKENILFLDVVSAGWAHNFLMIKEEILNKINNGFNDIIVKEIRFNVKAKIDKVEPEIEEIMEIKLPELDENEYKSIKKIVSDVHDKSLANKLANILKKDNIRKKYLVGEGYPVCCKCGVVLSYQGEYCSACEKIEKEELEKKLMQILFQLPWLTFEQAQQTMPVKYSLFKQAKEKCKQIFFENATKKNASRNDVQRYVMISTGLSVFDLTEEIVGQTMKNVWRTKHVPSFRSRYDG